MTKRNNPNVKALQQSNKGMYITIGALIAVAIVVLGGVILWAQRDSEASAIEFGATADDTIEVNEQGAVILGDEGAPVVQVWEDYLCPACQQFEAAHGGAMAEAVLAGDLRVEYHLLNFQDGQSASGEYSTRAIAATQCVAASEDAETYFAVKEAFFANQPTGGQPEPSPGEMADAAEAAGASDSLECIRNMERNEGLDKARDSADNSMISIREVSDQVSTPTVAHNGEQVDFQSPTWLTDIMG